NPKHKLLRFFIFDNCDYAGLWPIDYEIMSLNLGYQVTEKDLKASFKPDVEIRHGVAFIEEFLYLQYKEYPSLNPQNRVHSLIQIKLKRFFEPLPQGLPQPQGEGLEQNRIEQNRIRIEQNRDSSTISELSTGLSTIEEVAIIM